MIRRLLFSAHRILGTILSILFVVWFLSGFVMLYHNFPKVTNKDKYAHADILSEIPVSLDSILSKIGDNENIIGLKFASFGNKPYFKVVTHDTTCNLSDNQMSLFNYSQIENYAKRWNSGDIFKVDTLNELEQWIPFSRYRKDLPIYKFYFNDENKSQLYVSSHTGEPLQFTNKDNRFWAWLGPIPHWIYFTSLRQNGQLWSDVLIWISGFGSIMCFSGLILGIYLYISRYRKKKKWGTPYKKFIYKWHHILGFFFGFFVFTFVFSGMMSLAHIPQWIVKTHNSAIQERLLLPTSLAVDNYRLSISKILEAYPQKVKSIECSSFGTKPLYKVVVNDEQLTLDATNNNVKLLNLNEDDIRIFLGKEYSDSIDITLLNEYDNYYITRKDKLPLPVYRVDIDDADKSTYYIDPQTGYTQYFNSNDKVRKWSYQALHSYKIPFLIRNTVAWNLVMWTTMVGGTLVSFTGLWLAIIYIRRKLKKRKKHIRNS